MAFYPTNRLNAGAINPGSQPGNPAYWANMMGALPGITGGVSGALGAIEEGYGQPQMGQWIEPGLQSSLETMKKAGAEDSPLYQKALAEAASGARDITGQAAGMRARMGAAGAASPGADSRAAEAFARARLDAESQRATRELEGASGVASKLQGLYNLPWQQEQAGRQAYGQWVGRLMNQVPFMSPYPGVRMTRY